ncbi:Hypothetical protein CINCED_3A007782 [Cinara cedri]|uniref:Calpain catalytic domain-containing protein n=1 Tax=Cinara cedri TaxID=506608 RepID=A0A5E4NDM9_9HEMI|nr:Hypothetical protein CINCED_3A007782 [Cinara cedri]
MQSSIGKRDPGFRSTSDDVQNFEILRNQCLKKGVLFEDPAFKTVNSLAYGSKTPKNRLEWRRPGELTKNPKFFIDGVSRFDINQGDLGDCWLLAVMDTLTMNEKLFYHVVPNNQGFDEKYAGIFHFRFWYCGKWVNVFIDDRLPTNKKNELIYIKSSTKNEFWSALLEKAYAKFKGSYEALDGGFIHLAMMDFTGGVPEMFELNVPPHDLFERMLKAFQQKSLLCGAISKADSTTEENKNKQGLICKHAYSITSVICVNKRISTNTTSKISLIRIRNPWGDQTEWNGPWSDKSSEWALISDSEKKSLGLKTDADGEFWMWYNDFVKYFSRLCICHLDLNGLNNEQLGDESNTGRKIYAFEGEWVRGTTAGGSREFLTTFANNPQYYFKLEDADDDDDEHKCSVIIDLTQKNSRTQQKTKDLLIGFSVYQVINTDSSQKRLDTNFFKNTAPMVTESGKRQNISRRLRLFPGTYCIVPATSNPNEQGEFLLRVFSEHKKSVIEDSLSKKIDENVGLDTVDVKLKGQNAELNKIDDARRKNKGSFFAGLVKCISK